MSKQENSKTFKNKNIFDYLGNILVSKNIKQYKEHISQEGFYSDFKKIVVLRYLSMSNDVKVRNIILKNQMSLEQMDEKILYRYLIKTISRQSSKFIKYIK